jgi:hypothetical protein
MRHLACVFAFASLFASACVAPSAAPDLPDQPCEQQSIPPAPDSIPPAPDSIPPAPDSVPTAPDGAGGQGGAGGADAGTLS